MRVGRRAAAAALVLLSVAGVACGGGGDKKKVTTNASTSSTVVGTTSTSAPADPDATTTTVEAGPDTTLRGGGGPGTTAGPGPAATAPPATPPPGPVALTPAAPGVYHYATTGGATLNGTAAPFPPDTTNTIGAPAGVRQVASRDLRSGGNGSQISYTFDYRPDGLYLVSLVTSTSFGGYTDTRDLTPPAPLLFLATGAGPGASQTLNIPLSTGGSARVVVDVLGTEPVNVAGQNRDTLIVRSVANLPPGQITGTQSLTVNLDRASRLWVRERGLGDATGTVSGIPVNVHTEYTATITSLTPG